MADFDLFEGFILQEKALSKAQRRFFAIALQIKRGNIDPSSLDPNDFEGGAKGIDRIKQLAKDVPEKKIRDFAKTKEKNLPDRVKKRK